MCVCACLKSNCLLVCKCCQCSEFAMWRANVPGLAVYHVLIENDMIIVILRLCFTTNDWFDALINYPLIWILLFDNCAFQSCKTVTCKKRWILKREREMRDYDWICHHQRLHTIVCVTQISNGTDHRSDEPREQ